MTNEAKRTDAVKLLRKEYEKLLDVNTAMANLLIKELTVEPQHEKLQKKIRAELSKLQREMDNAARRMNSVLGGVTILKLKQ